MGPARGVSSGNNPMDESRSEGRTGYERRPGTAREKTQEGSEGGVDPLRGFTCIDLSSKQRVTRAKALGPWQSEGPRSRRTPALVESLGYAHNVLLVPGAGVAHEVVGLNRRCCPSQALRAERHDNEPSRRKRRRVDNADAFKHLHVGLGIIEVSLREPIRPLRRREHGDALLAVFILDIVEAPAPRAPVRLAPHADDVEMFFDLHAPPHNRGPGYPEGYPGPSCTLYALASLRAEAAEVKRIFL